MKAMEHPARIPLAAPAAPDLGRSLEPAAVPDLGRSAEPPATPRYTDVMFGYCGVLIDWRPRRTIEGLYPAGVVDMFFDPADPHGVAYYDDLADLGWSEERIIADYEREHGPAVAWIMRLYFEFQRLGFYDMIDGMPTLMRDLHARGVRLWGLTNFTVRGVREMHGKYPWLNLLGGTVISAQEASPSRIRASTTSRSAVSISIPRRRCSWMTMRAMCSPRAPRACRPCVSRARRRSAHLRSTSVQLMRLKNTPSASATSTHNERHATIAQ